MRKLIYVALCLFSIVSSAQTLENEKDLIGYWSSESTNLVIWKDNNNELQMVEFSVDEGKKLEILSFNKTGKYLKVKTFYESTNWIVESIYILKGQNTLECNVTGDGFDTIIYRKIK